MTTATLSAPVPTTATTPAIDGKVLVGLSHGAFGTYYAIATTASAVTLLWLGKLADTMPQVTVPTLLVHPTADTEIRVIDPEFGFYGPMGFDIGMLCANFLMAYFSQPAHRGADLEAYQDWILGIITDLCGAFEVEFRTLWKTERTGLLYPVALFEDQGHDAAPACDSVLAGIWRDAWTFCGIEMHRRCLSLAHNADFEEITDTRIRGPLEARNLMMGAALIHAADSLSDAAAVCALAREFNGKDIL